MAGYSFCSLYSGSSGNAMLLQTDSTKILIDAGKNAKTLCAALSEVGVTADELDAIFITHEHCDHISALRVLSHKYTVPIYILYRSALVFSGLRDEKLCACLNIRKSAGFETDIGNVHVRSFATHHDSNDACGYRFDIADGDRTVSVGYVTDCGFVSKDIEEAVIGCESVVLECNHDVEMLMNGPYPYDTKLRIRSKKGHLSNEDCASFAARLCEKGTKNIMLAHISRDNNRPELALGEVRGAVAGYENIHIVAASHDIPVWLVEDKKTAKDMCCPI